MTAAAMPGWLVTLAIGSLVLAGVCCVWIVVDLLAGNRQKMWIMNVVWPVTALYAGPFALWAYYQVGRLSSLRNMQQAKEKGEEPAAKKKPFWEATGLAATHCGSGCTLADIVAEWFLFFVPALTLFGVTITFELFGHRIFAAWVIDYIVALVFGIAFQYFTIKPMRDLSTPQALVQSLKADTLSLTAWQVGMYGWMAVVTFAIFGTELAKTNPVFWFMMQIAMIAGFFTSYPVNWWLLKSGIKEKM